MFHLILVFHDQNNMTLKVIVELHLAYSYSTFSFFSSVLLTCPLFIAFFWLTTATEYPSGFFSDLRLLNTPLVSFLTYGYWIPLWFLHWYWSIYCTSRHIFHYDVWRWAINNIEWKDEVILHTVNKMDTDHNKMMSYCSYKITPQMSHWFLSKWCFS